MPGRPQLVETPAWSAAAPTSRKRFTASFSLPDRRPPPLPQGRPGYDRVVPHENFFCLRGEDGRICHGLGAWEVGVRYDYLDLASQDINAGVGQGVSFCVNWYWTSNARVQANYILMHRDFSPEVTSQGRTDGSFDGFGLRFNCDF